MCLYFYRGIRFFSECDFITKKFLKSNVYLLIKNNPDLSITWYESTKKTITKPNISLPYSVRYNNFHI